MNGRIRRDLPRKTDLKALSEGYIEQIMLGHNFIPRKVLKALTQADIEQIMLGHIFIPRKALKVKSPTPALSPCLVAA